MRDDKMMRGREEEKERDESSGQNSPSQRANICHFRAKKSIVVLESVCKEMANFVVTHDFLPLKTKAS